MICTTATIVYLLGSMPPKGTVVSVPRSALAHYTSRQIERAKACAGKYGIRWRIAD